MSTQLHLTVTVQIVGDIPADDRTRILQAIDDGAIDLPLLQMLRSEFGQRGADWRFSLATAGASFEVTL